MKQSTLIWIVIVVLSGGFLAWRTAQTGMGRAYVEAETVIAESGETWTIEKTADAKNARSFNPTTESEAIVKLSWPRTIGVWCAAALTIAIFSFLWGDNPFYKLAEAIFVGVSAAYAMVVGFWTMIVNKLFLHLFPQFVVDNILPNLKGADGSYPDVKYLYLVPLVLGVMLLMRLAPQGGWISRWPLAFFIGATAGLRLVHYFQADFVSQIQATIIPLVVLTEQTTMENVSASIRNITLVVGVMTSLVYFFFSWEHVGVVHRISRVGIWVLMITFGASFGYTVMGRVALLAQRLEFLFDDWLWIIDPASRRLIGG